MINISSITLSHIYVVSELLAALLRSYSVSKIMKIF